MSDKIFTNIVKSGQAGLFKIHYRYATNSIEFRVPLATTGGVKHYFLSRPHVNRSMNIEVRTSYQSGRWVWEGFADGARVSYDELETIEAFITTNNVDVNIRKSSTSTITGLKYSLTEPCGKTFYSF